MKIIDNRLKAEDMMIGSAYQITWIDDSKYSIVMKVDNDSCEYGYIALVDLFNGTYFEVCKDEIASIEKLNAELILTSNQEDN